MIKAHTLKGFRDFLPREAKKRQYMIDTLQHVFALYGFEPLETPTLEYEDILLGKYGDEGDKLMYRFADNGERRVAMRYDQTVPLARVIAQYHQTLPMPFKRYQIQNVWRAENTQKGRYREFIQCDIDTVGTDSVLSDIELITLIEHAYRALGFTKIHILLNDRTIFGDLSSQAITSIDKLEKIGKDGVCRELVEKGLTPTLPDAEHMLETLLNKKPTERLHAIFTSLEKEKTIHCTFSPTLARGLDYYTGIIIEVTCPEYPYGSLGGGGRYDNLIGMFTNTSIPAVGFACGFDRTMEAMEALNLFPQTLTSSTTTLLITIFSPETKTHSENITSLLRQKNIPTEIYLDEHVKLDKQLKYADAKHIPYAVIVGPEEIEKNIVTLKNLTERTQKQLTLEELLVEFE